MRCGFLKGLLLGRAVRAFAWYVREVGYVRGLILVIVAGYSRAAVINKFIAFSRRCGIGFNNR